MIATSKFLPTVAEVIEKINAIQRGGEMTELEAWGYISRAIRNSTWHANEEWERLPEELRRMVSPDLLRSWAAIEADEVETVIRSNFLRTFRAAQARQKEYDALPGSVKQYIAQIGVKTDGLLCMPGQGVVTWIEQRGGYPYEFMGRCDCRAGRSIEGLRAASAHLSPFEISEISEKNKQIEAEAKKRREQNAGGE